MATSSYITVKNALEQFAENHLVIKRFKTSFFEQIDNFSSSDNTFPILYVVPSDVTFEQYTDRFFFRIYCVDILQKDRSNESAILNDTLLTLRDLYNWLKIADNGLNVLSTARAIPVNNFLVDYTAGWYLDVEVEGQAESNDCSIPFTDNFTLTGYTCDFTYASRFLTCETLEECQAIIDINDRIDAIIISADTFVTNGSYDNPSGTLNLVRNDGNILSITGFTTGATGGSDIYVTGGTFNSGSETLTLGRNDNQTVVITGFTSGGPIGFDVFVTGGTYSAGSATFTNNTGGTFSVSGFSTGGTGTVTSVTDDGNGVCNVDNTDPSNPIIGFNGVYVDGTTITGDGTIGNPLKATLVPGKNLVLYLDSVNQTWTATALSGDILTSAITTTQTTVTSNDNGNTRNVINFISEPDFFESTIIPDGFWLMHLFGSRNNGTVSFYTDIYYVDNDGVSNKTLIASGVGDPVPITNTIPIMLTQSLFSDLISLSDTNKRLIIEVFVITGSGNRTTTFYFRDSTISHIHTPLTAPSGSVTTFTGGTVTGPTNFTGGLTANTFSATTYLGLSLDELDDVSVSGATDGQVLTYSAASQTWVPTTVSGSTSGTDVFVTGGTYSSGTSVFTNNTGGTFSVSGYSTGLEGAAYPYVEREFVSANNAGAIIKIPGSDVIFVAYTTTGSVLAYNTLTGEILSTTPVAGAVGLVYVASSGEVWAFGSTAGSINRFTATNGFSLGATLVTSLTANCRGVYDDSLVTGNVYAYNGGTMNVITASTFTRAGVSIGGGSASWELTLVTSGPQAGLLVGSVNIGTFGFNKATNSLAYGPINLGGYQFIKFVPSLGVFIASSLGLNRMAFVTPTSSTTLALSTTLGGINTPYQFEFDETENRLFVGCSATSTAPLRIVVIELSTLTWIKSVLATAQTTNSTSYMASDKANKALYSIGVVNGGSVNKIIYA